MTNIQKLITWKRVKVNENRFVDPNTDWAFEKATEWATFTETPYQIADWRFISFVEYPDTTTQEQINTLINEYSAFEFTFIDEATVNQLLSELWDVSVNNFIFTDNRDIMWIK